jgi:hypothetical protein
MVRAPGVPLKILTKMGRSGEARGARAVYNFFMAPGAGAARVARGLPSSDWWCVVLVLSGSTVGAALPSCCGDGPTGAGCPDLGVVSTVVLPPDLVLGFYSESVEIGPFCLACVARFYF